MVINIKFFDMARHHTDPSASLSEAFPFRRNQGSLPPNHQCEVTLWVVETGCGAVADFVRYERYPKPFRQGTAYPPMSWLILRIWWKPN